MAQRQEFDTADGELIYESAERGGFYNCIRCLWCACTEPHHKITTKYVRVHRWDGCSQITDSMSMEAISDIAREQSCYCCCASCCCGCCIKDFADIILYGNDESTHDGKLVLINVAHSDQVMTTITRHLQETHKDFRKNKNMAQKFNEIKHNK
mmetsp:Transcript_59861/g.95166  ORF Transcript_59861/g.95166 Transcript_59861/m.95166 type:complete len:153 (-) Transcript_59861:300-758(-)